jgi:putative SOS response-associated peptidase YedK
MCARFTLRRRLNLVLQELVEIMLDPAAASDWDPTPAFNICPTQNVAAIRPTADADRNEPVPLKWGLIPSWSNDPKIATSCINARGETVATKPAFRSAFKKRRCLILADGYYEWTGEKGKKQPWHFHLPDDRAFAFAGLWECWRPEGQEPVETCTIVTTAANEFSAKYHDRMPVIVESTDYSLWLDPAAPTDRLLPLLDSRPVAGMEVVAVNPAVNNPRNQGPDLLTPQTAG